MFIGRFLNTIPRIDFLIFLSFTLTLVSYSDWNYDGLKFYFGSHVNTLFDDSISYNFCNDFYIFSFEVFSILENFISIEIILSILSGLVLDVFHPVY